MSLLKQASALGEIEILKEQHAVVGNQHNKNPERLKIVVGLPGAQTFSLQNM